MSILEDKSVENYNAIEILKDSKLYTPGIHCAYYSSLQLVMHYFYEYCDISVSQAQSDISKSNDGSHVYYLNKVVIEFSKMNRRNATMFLTYFAKFKKKRIVADYNLVEIKEEDLSRAAGDARRIRLFLNRCNEGKCENIYDL